MIAVSEQPCVVTIVVAPGSAMAWIRVVGAVETGAETALDMAIDRVQKLAPPSVVIDLAGVTFASSALPHFLVRMHAAAPQTSIGLHHAKPIIRSVSTTTGVDEPVTFDSNL